jgi:transglycosylase-like protein/putative peptidoglycan binding protein
MTSRTLRRALSRPAGSYRVAGLAAVAAVAAGSALLATADPAAAAAPTGAEPGGGHADRADSHPVQPPTLLAQGSVGPAVTDIQRAVHVRPTGRFDRATRQAVVRFQRRHHLLVDGLVGSQTWDDLFHISSGPSTPSPAAASAGYSIPAGIVQCESGGNYSAVNPSSGAGGAYQILPSTWQAYGGQGLPQDAPPAEQDRIAAAIYAHQGASAWTC